MTTRPGPPDPPERRSTPIPRRPQPPRRSQPPRPPAQPWYLEFRRPPVPPRVLPPRPPTPGRPVTSPPKPVAAQHRPNWELLIGAGVFALAVLTLVVRAVVGGSGPVELDVNHAQDGVRQVLTDPINGYGYEKVADVRCNNGVNPRVRKGSTFTCTVTVDGGQRQVLAEFSDDAGTYMVDRPR